jgi:hypothetical protein
MNAVSLIQRVSRRIPQYDASEYLDEINAAYKEVWDYILQLDDSYFTDIKIVTVTTSASEFDFLYNSNGFLNAPVSPRYFQIDRIRILQPGDVNWYPATPRPWNDPYVISQEQLNPQQTSNFPPYFYNPFAKGSIKFASPFVVGTQIEVIYSFIFLPLTYLFNGTVTVTGGANAVTGTNTSFTQLIGPDFQGGLPGTDQDTDIGVELVFPNNQTYRVKAITSDTALTTITNVSPAQSGATYNLAMVPDTPEGHHNVIATLATRNFMSTPASDSRLGFWVAQAEKELDSMRDSVMTRQRQAPARRGRFPQSVMRQNLGVPSTGR